MFESPFMAGYFVGMSVTILVGICVYQPFGGGDRRKQQLREIRYLLESNNGIITVSDLVFKLEISPRKAEKLLKRLAIQLDAEA